MYLSRVAIDSQNRRKSRASIRSRDTSDRGFIIGGSIITAEYTRLWDITHFTLWSKVVLGRTIGSTALRMSCDLQERTNE